MPKDEDDEPWASFRHLWKTCSEWRFIAGLAGCGFIAALWAMKGFDWLLRLVIP